MQLIDANTAQAGMTIVADEQTRGKGQRGKKWVDTMHQSLLASIILPPERQIAHQFAFNILLSLAIADYLQDIYESWDIRIKWPNDIIINDKKAGGILIENVIRGNDWVYSVIGIGINVLQRSMPADLPYATSLYMESKKELVIFDVLSGLRERIFEYMTTDSDIDRMLQLYNQTMYRKDAPQRFRMSGKEFTATIVGATLNGMLQLRDEHGNITNYSHGAIEWVYGY